MATHGMDDSTHLSSKDQSKIEEDKTFDELDFMMKSNFVEIIKLINEDNSHDRIRGLGVLLKSIEELTSLDDLDTFDKIISGLIANLSSKNAKVAGLSQDCFMKLYKYFSETLLPKLNDILPKLLTNATSAYHSLSETANFLLNAI